MKSFFRNHPMISMCVAMLVAAVLTHWIKARNRVRAHLC